MASASELTSRYIDACNRRDRPAMRELLAATLDFVRPGGGTLRTADDVMAQYERDWGREAQAPPRPADGRPDRRMERHR